MKYFTILAIIQLALLNNYSVGLKLKIDNKYRPPSYGPKLKVEEPALVVDEDVQETLGSISESETQL